MKTNNNSYEHMFYKTFSGTDSLAFMLLPECKPILLGSLTTISYSMYRDKKPVTLIGKTNVSGFTRGMRVIAGSMVFTLINQHLSKDLIEQVPYLAAHGKLKADELPLFDIMVISANEYGAATRMMIYGVDITDDAQVLSIQDLFTENTFNFVARDLDEFTAYKGIVNGGGNRRRSLAINAVMPYDLDSNNYENARKLMLNNIKNEDLLAAQSELVRKGFMCKATGVYDNETVDAVKKVQLHNSINPTGVLDRATFDLITSRSDDDRKVVTVSSSKGAFVYNDKERSKINGIAKHKDTFLGSNDDGFYKISFFGNDGYISKSDIDKNINYDVAFHTNQGIVNIDNGDYSKIGITIKPDVDLELKLSAIATYGKDKDCFSKYIPAIQNRETKVSLEDITDAYIYNVSKKSKPNKITFIVLSQGVFIYKWEVLCNE